MYGKLHTVGPVLCRWGVNDPSTMDGMQEEVLMERAEWCRRYAQINAVALRKVNGRLQALFSSIWHLGLHG